MFPTAVTRGRQFGFAVAIRPWIPATELQRVIFAYPTNGSDIHFMLWAKCVPSAFAR